MPAFSKKEAIGFGWKKFKESWKFLVSAVFISQAVSFVPTVFNFFFKSETLAFLIFTLTFSLIIWIVKTVIDMGLIRIFLKIHDSQSFSLADLFSKSNLKNYFLGTFSYYLMFMGLLMLLFIPIVLMTSFGSSYYLYISQMIFIILIVVFLILFIVYSIRFQFYGYLIIDKGLGPIEALKKSWEITKGVKLNLFLFGGLVTLINFVGALGLLLGLFISIPVTMLAQTYVYRKLVS